MNLPKPILDRTWLTPYSPDNENRYYRIPDVSGQDAGQGNGEFWLWGSTATVAEGTYVCRAGPGHCRTHSREDQRTIQSSEAQVQMSTILLTMRRRLSGEKQKAPYRSPQPARKIAA